MTSGMLSFWMLALLDNSSARDDPLPPKETEEWTGYSVALHILLPVAGFCILWGRRDLLTRLMLQIDRNCISVFCPSFSQREKLLKWASENLPSTWSSPSKTLSGGIPDLWKDGSLLCTLINMAVPGACPNPPKHWKKPPTHAQALAYKYLGITPVFTEKDFEEVFSPTQEKKFLFYLQEIQQAMKNHNAENENLNFSTAYLTKGMGLQTGEQYRKTIFYVYSNTTSSNCNNILVYIRGPYGSKGTATVPAFYNLNSIPILDYSHKFKASDKIVFKKEARRSFFKSIALDLTSFVNMERKVSTNDVPIRVEIENDRAKVTYIPNNYGIYEINLITNGEILKSSPFIANIIESISGVKDCFDSTEKILKELPVIKKKRIVSRYIDCINEKIQLDAIEEDCRKKQLIQNLKSEVSVHCNIKTAPSEGIQHQTQSQVNESKSYQPDLFEKLEKINEDQCENESDHLHNETDCPNNDHGNSPELRLKNSFCSRNFNIIPTFSVTEPEEEEHIVDKMENYLENVNNDVDSAIDSNRITPQETENTRDIVRALKIIDDNEVEEHRIDAIASIKPFKQYKEEPAICDVKEMVGDQSRNKLTKMREIYENSSLKNCQSGEAHVEEIIEINNFKKNKDDRLGVPENQNRPTSIVSPFLKITRLSTIENAIENESEPISLPDMRQDSHVKVQDLGDCKIKNEICLAQLNESNEQSQLIVKYHDEYDLYDQKMSTTTLEYVTSESEVLLPDTQQNENFIGNNYVESLKAILINKMNSQPSNTKIFKDIVNTKNKLKGLYKYQDFQDENNNEFKQESSSASPICPDHIAQEVALSQSVGELSLTERRKIFTRQQCVSIPSSSNSSISERENEDVSDGHKYSLRVLSVIDAIKNATNNGNILNRNTSISVPNISKSKHVEDDYSSSDISKASADFRSSFLRTREYWNKMSSENCLSTTSQNAAHERGPINPKLRNLTHSLSYSPDIYRSADDILSMSVNFKTNRLRRYSSLNQKDLETIDFISIEERKKRLLQDKYEQECLGSRFIKKHILSRKINHELKIEKIQDVAESGCEGKSKQEIFPKSLTSINPECPNPNKKKDESDERIVKKESQFKRAITFFKNLEKSTSTKRKLLGQKKTKPEIRRRYSLDFQRQHEDKSKGGSLRAPKTIEKFSITQIYFDIMSNRRGSFKGSPNRKALSETLASLPTNNNSNQVQNKDSEDGIKYNMFLNKLKTKKRRSIKSVFDIHY